MGLDLFYFSGGPRERVLRAILDAGHRVKHVFVNDPDRWPKVRSTIEMAEATGLAVTVVKAKSDLAGISEQVAGGICFSAGFSYLFPKAFLDRVKNCINVHGSLLPKYGGARTLSWCLEDGESVSGVTVHFVDEGMDTGPIILQRSFPLSPFETTRSLARKTGDFETEVVVDALKIYELTGCRDLDGSRPQQLAVRPNRTPEHSLLDARRPLIELFNKIRAADPDKYPAHFYVDGQKVCIRVWRPDKPDDEADLV
jgi:methionyl-tRNA formyltransferase